MFYPVFDENDYRGKRQKPWVMWSLLVVNLTVAILMELLPFADQLFISFQFGVTPAFLTKTVDLNSWLLLGNPLWTLLTYGFVHSSWTHLSGNMVLLSVFGDNIERALGHTRFLLFYFLCQITGAIAQIAWDPSSHMAIVGGSAGVSGLIGAYLLVRPKARIVMMVFRITTIKLKAYWVIAAFGR